MTRRRRGSLVWLTAGLCGATALLVAVMFTVLLMSVLNLRSDDTSARRASDELAQANMVERSVVDLETGLRGFLLTRERPFLEPFDAARARLPQQLATLRDLSMDAPDRQRIDALERSVRGYISGYALPLIATGGRLSHAGEVTATARGKALVDALRARFDALNQAEAALRSRGRAAADAQSSTAVAFGSVGLVLSILLLTALALYIILRLLLPARTVARAAEKLAAGQLSVRVPEIGQGEVAMLAESFNGMAETLQARDYELSTTHSRLQDALDEAREVSLTKSNFLANMSHEIRTPLNGVYGMLELLAESDLDPEQAELVRVARASGDALMSVVNDVLDIAKIESGRLELENRDFDLHELVESSCDMVAATAVTRSLELQSFVHDDVPRMIRGDRTRIGQILANLMSNAVKFTAEGEVVLEVSNAGDDAETAEVRFEVRDTGIGIAPERITHLFEPFTQADAGTTRVYGGTGLGLSIVRELTSIMNGRIEVDSRLGEGSVFACTIPLRRTAARPAAPAAEDDLRGLRVLIVDDNATNRRIFDAYTSSWGMLPAQCDSAESALAQLERAHNRGTPFDIALIDFHMPGSDGVELAQAIRAVPAHDHTRIILLTSSGEIAALEAADIIDHTLAKPVRQSRLLDAIGTVMATAWAADAARGRADGAAAGEDAAVAPVAPHRILVAEDQSVNWMLVQRMLTRRGHHVVNAANGQEALEMLEAEPYDLVFMDCQMPVLDGYATAREIRRREAAEGRERIPIVAMTAHALQGDRERCLAAGMDDYVAKPISRARVDAMLARWLAEREPRPETLDAARVAELRTLFPDGDFVEMVAELRDDVTAQLELIATAIPAGDATATADAAHRVLNTARMIGATRLIAAAAALETVAEHRDRALREHAALAAAWWEASVALEHELVA